MTARQTRDQTADRSWMEDAACRDQPSGWFTDPADQRDVDRALATCAGCRVRTACLTTALSHPEAGDVGIWGGTTEDTRRRIRDGALDVDDVRNASLRRRAGPADAPRPRPTVAPQRRTTEVARLPVPELTVGRTARGTYESADGCTVIFRIHGEPPWMLMIDDRPIARTDTLTDACRLAWTTPHSGDTRSELDRLEVARNR